MSRIWKWTELLLLTPKRKLKRSEGVKEKRRRIFIDMLHLYGTRGEY